MDGVADLEQDKRQQSDQVPSQTRRVWFVDQAPVDGIRGQRSQSGQPSTVPRGLQRPGQQPDDAGGAGWRHNSQRLPGQTEPRLILLEQLKVPMAAAATEGAAAATNAAAAALKGSSQDQGSPSRHARWHQQAINNQIKSQFRTSSAAVVKTEHTAEAPADAAAGRLTKEPITHERQEYPPAAVQEADGVTSARQRRRSSDAAGGDRKKTEDWLAQMLPQDAFQALDHSLTWLALPGE